MKWKAVKALARAYHRMDIFSGTKPDGSWYLLSLKDQSLYLERASWSINNPNN